MKAVSVILLIGCIAALTLGTCGFILYGGYSNDKMYEIGDFSYSASDVERVIVDWVGGSVEINSSDSDLLRGWENSDLLRDEERLHYYLDKKARTLNVRYCEAGHVGHIDEQYKQLTLEIPDGAQLELKTVSASVCSDMLLCDLSSSLETTSGALELGTVASKRLTLQSVSGDITLKNVAVDGDITFKTTSGRIAVGSATGEQIEVKSVSGSVELSGMIAESASIATTSGDIELERPDCGELRLSSTSGTVTLYVGDDASMAVDFRTTSGAANLQTGRMEGSRILLGSGEHKVRVETTSGGVNIIPVGD